MKLKFLHFYDLTTFYMLGQIREFFLLVLGIIEDTTIYFWNFLTFRQNAKVSTYSFLFFEFGNLKVTVHKCAELFKGGIKLYEEIR